MDILKRMHAARSAAVTCSASRHAAEIGETMARYECYPLTDDPGEAQEAGESIAAPTPPASTGWPIRTTRSATWNCLPNACSRTPSRCVRRSIWR